VRANLRKESGAAIGVAEMDQERRNYFPIPGDSPETVAQKAHNRQVVEQAMRTAAGGAMAPPSNSNQSPEVQKGLQLLQEARQAIQNGADKAQVAERLRKLGYTNLAGRL